jgi:hypothetical protein
MYTGLSSDFPEEILSNSAGHARCSGLSRFAIYGMLYPYLYGFRITWSWIQFISYGCIFVEFLDLTLECLDLPSNGIDWLFRSRGDNYTIIAVVNRDRFPLGQALDVNLIRLEVTRSVVPFGAGADSPLMPWPGRITSV